MWANVEEFCGPAFSIKFEKQEYLGNQEEIWFIWQKEMKQTRIGLFQSYAAFRNTTIFNLMRRGKNSKSMMGSDLHIKGHSELEER